MNLAQFSTQFSSLGSLLLAAIAVLSVGNAALGLANLLRPTPWALRPARLLLSGQNLLFAAGFVLILWFHYRIYQALPLELPSQVLVWLNDQLAAMNAQAAYALPALTPGRPPRYIIPLWIENEKYYFWFMCYGVMAWQACRRCMSHRLAGALLLLQAGQTAILWRWANPFLAPLPKFFAEIGPWFAGGLSPMQQVGLFMRLYPRLVFYYNAPYMWLHPPMLFLAYGAITITFLTSLFMLVQRQAEIEALGYDYAKFGYFMLTLGMLLGYPWALQAWGPNWWWDPKICSSIMMWAIYSTYLHTRLYANKAAMWYFTSGLGILCFVAMLFTFITSFLFPGEHTFQ